MSTHHPFGELLTELRMLKPGLSQNRLAELAGYAPAILVRMCQGKKDLTGPSGRERIARIVGTLCDEGVKLSVDDVNALLASANLPPLYEGQPVEAALIRRLQGRVISAAPSVVQRTNLLPALTSFVGREAEVAELVERLTKARLITLIGAGGVGKTRLALEVARQTCEMTGLSGKPVYFKDGVWLAELAPLTDSKLVAPAVAQVLGISVGHDGSAMGALQRHLQSKHVLLVLDNCEHLVDACAELIEETLLRCPHVHVLATSREALRIPGETIWQVPSLTIPATARLTPQRLLECEAARLFVERASASQRLFKLTHSNAASIAHICQRLEGIPLALELAAALTQAMTVQEIAKRLDKHLPLLTEGYRRAAPRQQTMRGALNWSYGLLTLPQQRLLAYLSVFTGGWTMEAAEAIYNGDPSEVAPALLQLVRKSLALANPHEAGTRYRLLEPIRQFAAEKLSEMGEETLARDRHLACFTAFAERVDAGMMHHETSIWIERVLADFENLREAYYWSREGAGDCESALRLAASLWRFWMLHAQLREGQMWITMLLEACGTISNSTRARAMYALAVIYRYLRDYDSMVPLAEESLALCRELNDRNGIAFCFYLLAVHAKNHFDYAREAALREESLGLFYETGDVFGIGNTLLDGVWTAMDRGEYAQAKAQLEEFAALSRESHDLNGIWVGYWERALIALRCNDHTQAIANLEQTLPVARESGISEFIARAIELWAIADIAHALALGRVELDQRREAGDSLGIANMLLALGRISLDVSDLDQAESLLTECVYLWDQIGSAGSEWGGAGWASLELGHVARMRGNFERAIARHEESRHRHEKAGATDGSAAACLNLGHATLAQGDAINAMQWFKRSLSQYRDAGMRAGIAFALAGLAKATQLQGLALPAARFAGAASSLLRDDELATMRPIARADFERCLATFHADASSPSQPDFTIVNAFNSGQHMSLEKILAFALSDES